MSEPPVIAAENSKRANRVVWTAVLVLVAAVVIGLVIVFLVHPRSQPRPEVGGRPLPDTPNAARPSFADLRDSAIPGRYKHTQGGTESFIVLYADHTFMNKDGTIFTMYHWEVTPDALSITFSKGTQRYTVIEAPGVYSGTATDGTRIRLEKLPPYEASQLQPPTPVATVVLGAAGETNGLMPVNTGADGRIYPASIGGLECCQLVRKENRTDAYLYLQISPRLKEPPFTNALILVEYFDPPPEGGRTGTLVIHYDARHGPYARTQPLVLGGSQTWQEATFFVAQPLFQNRQNARGDFRLAVTTPDLFVRSVKLLKNTLLPERKLPISTPR